MQRNGLDGRVRVVQRKASDCLLPLDELGIASLDFTMTNPPFYGSEDEMLESAAQKSRPPFTACSGAKIEMVTEGGEIGFFNRILAESLELRDRVQWYTSMLGFLSSVPKAVELLLRSGVDNYAVTEFVQGSKTRRWAVGWSFGPMRPTSTVARSMKTRFSRNVLPPVTELDALRLARPERIGEFADRLRGAIEALDLVSWHWDREKLEGVGRAADKVWGRVWRRKKKREADEFGADAATAAPSGEGDVKFGFKVFVHVTKAELVVGCRWLEGHETLMLESFRGYLKTTARAAWTT